jgi:hypothetical protein
MHNEFVGTRAPRAAAFVCFKAAEKGGEFIVADGRRMFQDLDSDVVEELYNRNIRYSVMELPFFGWIDNVPGPLKEPVMTGVRGLVSAAINAKVDFSVEMLWGEEGYDNTRMLQARAPSFSASKAKRIHVSLSDCINESLVRFPWHRTHYLALDMAQSDSRMVLPRSTSLTCSLETMVVSRKKPLRIWMKRLTRMLALSR